MREVCDGQVLPCCVCRAKYRRQVGADERLMRATELQVTSETGRCGCIRSLSCSQLSGTSLPAAESAIQVDGYRVRKKKPMQMQIPCTNAQSCLPMYRAVSWMCLKLLLLNHQFQMTSTMTAFHFQCCCLQARKMRLVSLGAAMLRQHPDCGV
jgi:hypothetical protein